MTPTDPRSLPLASGSGESARGSATLNPNDFVITRRRKKYKFAKFANAENCFELSEWTPRAIDCVEIGAGTGLFSVELAARHPERTYLALDVKADRLQKGAYEALERGLTNIFFVRARADQLDQVVAAGSVATIWVTFADPFPRPGSSGRRMTHPNFLAKYATSLASKGRLLIKHDNLDFFHWTLEQLVTQHWRLDELSFALPESDLSDEYKLPTTYETRWHAEGRTTYFVAARKAKE